MQAENLKAIQIRENAQSPYRANLLRLLCTFVAQRKLNAIRIVEQEQAGVLAVSRARVASENTRLFLGGRVRFMDPPSCTPNINAGIAGENHQVCRKKL